MDDGRAASDAVMASSGAHQVAGYLNRRITSDQRPREAPFSFASFLLGEQKKRRFNKTKNISQPEEHDAPKH
ncbi:MAG: hypothetical protein IKO05_04995 [Selenomonadaceae bacterium]|nr:hypothetical protein [Selenomonadaceae bacterium]